MLKNSIYLLGLLAIVAVGMTGCASVEKADISKKNASIANLPQTFEGTWVVQLLCDSSSRGVKQDTKYGLLEIEKDGRTSYEAKFYLFEPLVKNQALPFKFKKGSILDMEGSLKNNSSEIELIGNKWLLESNKKNSMGLRASLHEKGFFLKGTVIGNPSCSSFLASKVPVNDARVKNPIFPLNEILKKSRSKKNPTSLEKCKNLLSWMRSGASEVIFERTLRTRKVIISSLYFDESFVKHFGKTYKNWTNKDAIAFSGVTKLCGKTNYNNHNIGMPFLFEGKRLKPVVHRGSLNLFSKEPLNIQWAGNYFVLSAVKSAKIHKQNILYRLQKLDSSDVSFNKIKEYSNFNEFPFNFLPLGDKKEFQKNLSKMRNDIKGENAEKLLMTFDFSQYPKTLQGLISLKKETHSLRQAFMSLDNHKKREELNNRYEDLIREHSLASSQEIIRNIPHISLTPDGLVSLEAYKNKINANEATYLLRKHKRNVNKNLVLVKKEFFVNFSENMTHWVTENIPNGDEGLRLLNDAAEKLLGNGLLSLHINNVTGRARRDIANQINKEVIKRQHSCDLLASHPADNQKSKFVHGVLDINLNIELAIDACIASIEKEPNTARFSFQLGRALFVGQLYEDAFSFFEDAANDTHLAANFYLAEYYSRGLGSVEQNFDEAIKFYELAENDGFSPALIVLNNIREELRIDRKNQEAEKREKLRIINAKFKLDRIMKPFLSGEFENIPHGLGMAYIIEVAVSMYKICDTGISQNEVNAMVNIIFEKNALGYVSYFNKKPTPRNEITRSMLLKYNAYDLEKTGPKINAEKYNLIILQDMSLFLGKYGCFGKMYNKFMANSKKFILDPDVPPYNLTSEPFWNICMNESNNAKTTKGRFCSCFLPKIRNSDVSRKLAKNLYNNFWPTAQGLIKNPQNNLSRCTVPSKNRF